MQRGISINLFTEGPPQITITSDLCAPPPTPQRFFAVQKIIVNVITRCKRCIPRAGEKWNNSGAKNGGKKMACEELKKKKEKKGFMSQSVEWYLRDEDNDL